jgi:hypothetical protein
LSIFNLWLISCLPISSVRREPTGTEDNPGVIWQAINDVFDYVEEASSFAAAQHGGTEFNVAHSAWLLV